MEEKSLDLTRPNVINIKKKKKRRYSSGLKDIQIAGRRMSRISSRTTRAVSKGINGFRKASNKSSQKKRDGALRDFPVNLAKGMSRGLRAASPIPHDIARSFDTRSSRRFVRLQIRSASRLSRLLRLR